jgi:hypothetical protein
MQGYFCEDIDKVCNGFSCHLPDRLPEAQQRERKKNGPDEDKGGKLRPDNERLFEASWSVPGQLLLPTPGSRVWARSR